MLPGSPDLPPGCTDAMIERRFGGGPEDCDACDGTGELNRSDCCDVPLHGDYQDFLMCPKCGQGCERQKCERCDGGGDEPNIENQF